MICLLLILWKKALKADYDECMKHSNDCNREHIDHYEGEVSSWIIFLVFCILVGVYIYLFTIILIIRYLIAVLVEI